MWGLVPTTALTMVPASITHVAAIQGLKGMIVVCLHVPVTVAEMGIATMEHATACLAFGASPVGTSTVLMIAVATESASMECVCVILGSCHRTAPLSPAQMVAQAMATVRMALAIVCRGI
jgi:hypothetical protein